MDDVLKVLVDLSEVDEADNERTSTTYYGGRWRVGEKVGLAYGDDRSDNHYDDVRDEILRLCKERWTEEPDVPLEPDFTEDVMETLQCGLDGDRFFIVLKNEGGGAFHTYTEEAPISTECSSQEPTGDD